MAIQETLQTQLLQLIRDQRLIANGKLPSERFMLETFGSSRVTIREALMRLESRGVIYRQNRKGWFVSPSRFTIDLTRKIDFTAMAVAQSRVPVTAVQFIRRTKPLVSVREALEIDVIRAVYELRRVRSLDGRPVMMEDIYLDARRFEGIEQFDLNGSITRVQREAFGVSFTCELSTIRVLTLPKKLAACLSVNAGTACLQILRTRFDAMRKPVDYNVEYWLHNSIEMVIDGHSSSGRSSR